MRLPPIGFVPDDTWTVHNGQAAKAMHAQEIDRFTTWLATAPPPCPTFFGLWVAGTTFELEATAPQFVASCRLAFFACGRGRLDCTCDDDGTNVRMQVYQGDGSVPVVADADWWMLGPAKLPAYTADQDRALEVDEASSPVQVRLTWTITDFDGTHTLEVYAVRVVWDLHDEAAGALPA